MNRKTHARRSLAIGAAALLLVVPLITFAQSNEPFGRQIVNQVFARLCAAGVLKGPRCQQPPPPPTATLTLLKTVVNDNGGTATSSAFQARIDGNNVAWGATTTVSIGTHTASEVATSTYSASSWGGDCNSNGTIVLTPGDNKTCTITNDDIAQASTTGQLIVDKVTQPSGSSAEFSITLSGSGTITGGGAGTTTDATSRSYEVTPGTYSATEATSSAWMLVSNTCSDIVVAAGETETCTITNAKLPTLTVTKVIVNDEGGTGTTTDFALMIDGATTTSGVAMIVATGTRVVSEGAHAGYISSIGGDCLLNGNITLAAGDNKTCIITNDDEEVTGQVMISEVYYDVASTTTTSSNDSLSEWVELYNGTNSVIDLQGWWIGDEASLDMIPSSFVIQPGSLAIIAASSTPPGIPGGVPVFVLHSGIGSNGFANDGDAARLMNAASTTIDMVGYGDNTSVSPNVVIPGTGHDGHSIMRVQLNADTNAAADWADTDAPTPGS